MEPAKIDWKRIDSRFVEDCVYEHINAPKWVDFLASDHASIDDEAWFCRPDCKHPKTAEDFLKATATPPSNSKLASSANGGGSGYLPLREWIQGDAKLKRRGQPQPTFNEDGENQNPNLSTPPTLQAKCLKAAIKSSSEKHKPLDTDMISQSGEAAPQLKSSLSARNLFAGRDILNHITEFCNELKKLATRARERENEEKLSEKKSSQEATMEKKEVSSQGKVLSELASTEKERKPLLELGKEKLQGGVGLEKGSAKEKERKKKTHDEAENIPMPLNLENVKHKGEERLLLQIRTNPPSPQCFSAPHAPAKTTPSKASRSRLMERGVLQELKQNKEMKKDETAATDKAASVVSTNIIDGRQQARPPLDVFWFLKPCTLSE